MKALKKLNVGLDLFLAAIQTVLRKHLVQDGYEQMKDLSRGKQILREDLHRFIDSTNLPLEDKQRLKNLNPSTYIGIANKLAKS